MSIQPQTTESDGEKRYSNWESFEFTNLDGSKIGLQKELLKAIYGRGFVAPSPTQQKCLPVVLSAYPIKATAAETATGTAAETAAETATETVTATAVEYEYKDAILQAQSGTGKTLTFGIASVFQLLRRYNLGYRLCANRPSVLILSPTRELAAQTYSRLSELTTYTNIRIERCIGGISERENVMALNAGVDIVIGTPGRVRELVARGKLIGSELMLIVLDEADRMLHPEDGFIDELVAILGGQSYIPENCQFTIYSSTFPPDVLSTILRRRLLRDDAIKVLMNVEDLPLAGISQFKIEIPEAQKVEVLSDLYSSLNISQTMIFTNTKQQCNKIHSKLSEDGFTIHQLTSDTPPNERIQIHDDFVNGRIRILVTTDVMARGIDIKGVSYVINVDIPKNMETYYNRVGRTGRYGCKGVAINLVSPDDVKKISAIEQFYSIRIEAMPENFIEYA